MRLRTEDSATDGHAFGVMEPGRPTARLWLLFLAPVTIVIVANVGLQVLELSGRGQQDIEHEAARAQNTFVTNYEDDVEHHADTLQAAMEVLRRDPALRAALAQKDRPRLLALGAPILADLRREFGITHFYFSGPDRVNVLRVHQPDRYGDVIDRFTTTEAERTGTTAHGVELGPLGTLTLRLVTPWYEDGAGSRLIGYVELGMEIDGILLEAQDLFDVQAYALISKGFVQREAWETGMKMLGRVPDWDRFPDVVLSSQAARTLPSDVAAIFAEVVPRTRRPRRSRSSRARPPTDWCSCPCATWPAASSAGWRS